MASATTTTMVPPPGGVSAIRRAAAPIFSGSNPFFLTLCPPLTIAPRRSSAGQRRSFCWALQQQEKPVQRTESEPDFSTRQVGEPHTLSFRTYLEKQGRSVSPWHDVPLRYHGNTGLYHFVVEIPKGTSAKMEVATDEVFTPIKQDTKKGKLRYYPYAINWNYGMLPQTWEDPNLVNGAVDGSPSGDNDPLDVVEIGDRVASTGEVMRVKPLAVLAMIDEGELDWKVVAISVDDPKAELVNDEHDVERYFPGTLDAIRDWFRDYKIPDGKPANKFGLGNKAAGTDYALKVIDETHHSWRKLVTRAVPASGLSLA